MKCTIPEISWHNKDPVLSIDVQPKKANESFFRLASGGTDSHILIWHVTEQECGIPILDCAADLTRHQKAVNVVRFSPKGEFLASGDDESAIIIWKQRTDCDLPQFPGDGEESKEQWMMVRTLRGHLEDVYDLSWSPDEANLISGSVDNTALVWDVKKGHMLYILRDHKSFVQGVAWDPLGQYVATNSSDRTLRVFNTATRKLASRVSKAILPNSEPDAKPAHLFHDDTLKSFFRRLSFTPCGSLLIVPSGVIEEPKLINTTLIFTRNNLSKPVAYLPSNQQYSVAVRCCPQLFALMKTGAGDDATPQASSVFALPYRVVFAIATQSSVILYDTQHMAPFAYVANIHYTRLTDLAWSSDGRLLVVSSSDGYCSLISFAEGELGEIYVPPATDVENKTEQVAENAPTEPKSKSAKGRKNKNKLKSKEKGSTDVKNCEDVKCNDEDDDDDFRLVLEETVSNVIDSTVKTGDEVLAKTLDKNIEKDSTVKTSDKVNTGLEKDSNKLENDPAVKPVDKVDKTLEKDSNKLENECTVKTGDTMETSSVEDSNKLDDSTVKTGDKMETASVKDSKTPVKTVDVVEKDSKPQDCVSDQKNEVKEKSEASVDCEKVVATNSENKPAENSTPAKIISVADSPSNSNSSAKITPIEQRKPKRAQLITLSSPKSKRKL
ncbi:chromatin assembly factor 1 subunit B [Nilaparvata lugens]|uniref:chromatin assembly factor 1 subunit B n=1 Tax=Nilaparvata lugens TaxID=108931 RepID=UPI00193D65CB|nr:chromatin assembly factor 1 subunit B [Nilaparvata lugens]